MDVLSGTVNDQAEHDWIVAQWHNWAGVDIDLWCGFNDAAVEGTFVWVSGETPGFTNWYAGELNHANAGEDYTIIRKNNVLGLWNDVPDNPTGFHAGVRGVIEIGSAPPAPFCFGDGTLTDHTTPCPCGNTGGPGRGCANSVEATGAVLSSSGAVVTDNVVLGGSGMPATVSCIYLQGDATDDVVFGDGVRCAGGMLLRLRTKANVGGASSFPDSTDTITLSARGGVTVGSGARRHYQTYYRNSAALSCPPATFNVTNGLVIDWCSPRAPRRPRRDAVRRIHRCGRSPWGRPLAWVSRRVRGARLAHSMRVIPCAASEAGDSWPRVGTDAPWSTGGAPPELDHASEGRGPSQRAPPLRTSATTRLQRATARFRA